MNLITPHFEIWEQGIDNPVDDMYKHIAKCTRVCYQSEKKGTGETDEDFVRRVILRHDPWNSEANHLSMLEHGTVYLKVPYEDRWSWLKFNPYCKTEYINGILYVTTNFRVIIENGVFKLMDCICKPTKYHQRRITVSFTTNIGVTREFNRHRVNSMAEESTRYCNYSIKNDGSLNIGLPAWLLDDKNLSYIETHQFDSIRSYVEELFDYCANDDCSDIIDQWTDIDFYLFSLTISEWCYNKLIAKGWTPQKAREVLPIATKSQLVHTAFIDDWKHFFNLRACGVSGLPHPNAKLLAEPLMQEFVKRYYI